MTAPIWQTPVGFLGTLTERDSVSVTVVASGTNVTYALISGGLPKGLLFNAQNGSISGIPSSVAQVTSSTFVIRAKNIDGLSDRTFNLDVFGPSAPIWDTPAGALAVGPNSELYTLNKEYVDYTVRAETDVLTGGNKLRYYIAFNAGQLPPGLTLTEDGRIYGFVNDQLQLDFGASTTGGYDNERYDGYPFDHYSVSAGSELTKPEAINKTYQFTITATDSFVSTSRTFTIEVDDPNNLRADNSVMQVDTGNYLASVSYLLPPLWQNSIGENLTKISNLGMIRANRAQIITLHEYDPYPFVGPIRYDWSALVNPEIPLVTDSHFNIGRATTNKKNQNQIYFKNATVIPVIGQRLQLSEYVVGADPVSYRITGVVLTSSTDGYLNLDQPLRNNIPDSTNIYVGSASQHPPGMYLDGATGQLYGQIPYQPAYSINYRFTIKIIKTDLATGNTVSTSQIFILSIKGESNSAIQWISNPNLGQIIPGQTSELRVEAVNTNTTYSIEYRVILGALPPGLSLYPDGTIQGQIPGQASTGTVTYNFTVQANDVYLLSAVERTFTIDVVADTINQYAQIYVRPFLPTEQRNSYRSFVGNPVVFDPASLYRPNDPNFGVQTSIKMVIETGIQLLNLDDYVLAMQEYFTRKRFYFGDVKSVVAEDSSRTAVYELVYVEIVDGQMIGNISPSNFVYTNNNTTATDYPSTIGNMQTALESIVIDNTIPISVDERLQPKYMTTIQPGTGLPLGFIKAVPVCYALPGQSDKIISRIKSSGFDFKVYDFDTDRIIIENNTSTAWIANPTDVYPGVPVIADEYGDILTDENGDPLEGY